MTDCFWYTLCNEYMEHERNNLEAKQTTALNDDKDGVNVIRTAKLHVMSNLHYVVMYSHIMLIHLCVRINGGGCLVDRFSDWAASWMIQDSILSMDKRFFFSPKRSGRLCSSPASFSLRSVGSSS